MNSATSLSLKILSIFSSIHRPSSRRGLVLIATACFALSPAAWAVTPAPDGDYPGGITAEGENALFKLTSGNDNTAIGFDALYNNTTGVKNTSIGSLTLLFNTTGNENTASGWGALFNNTTGSNNTANGSNALDGNDTGSQNTASGASALFKNKTGFSNTATGFNALFFNTSGPGNTSDGSFALYNNTTGNNNTAMGNYALLTNTIASQNTAIGGGALEFSTGANNIALGYNAGVNLTTGSNNIAIGASGVAGDAGKIRIGKSSTATGTYIAGIYGKTVASASGVAVRIDSTGKLGTVLSSARYKQAIKPMDKASEALLALEPVTFRYKEELDPDGAPQFGLIAEQVEKVDPSLVVRDEDGKVSTVRYEAVNAMLLNEFLKEHRTVQEQQTTITELKSAVAKQQTTATQQQKKIEALTAGLQKVNNQVQLTKPRPKLIAKEH